MGPIAAVLIALLLVNVWATSFVARHVPVGIERMLLFALIWLIPGGVLVAILAAMSRKASSGPDTDSRLLEAVAEQRKQLRD